MNTTKLAYKRVVLKFGTSLLTGGKEHLDLGIMSSLASQVAGILSLGAEVVIVTSGAVAAGKHKLKDNRELNSVPLKQVLAAVGQARLMQVYEELFEKHNIVVAQALLTKSDLSERTGYLNARNTFTNLLELGIVSIVNENDVVAVDEIKDAKFGDNDNLSAMVANLVDADLLLILSDIQGLFTADPNSCHSAELIREVDNIDSTIEKMAGGSASKLGTGGMSTKISAARLATASGVNVIITDGKQTDIITRIMRGEAIGTRFIPSATKLESRERWMLSGLSSHGHLTIDKGAAESLLTHYKSLLPAGVTDTHGNWQRGELIDIYADGKHIGSGIANYCSEDIQSIKGRHSTEITQILGYSYGAELIHRNNMTLLNHRRPNVAGQTI